MINGKKVIAYIPARSGSKGIKDKNIIDVCGKPLIAYSIEAAKKSKYVDLIIVSTDSAQYAEIAKEYGAEVPFLRPSELATDNSPEMETTQHLMQWIEDSSNDFNENLSIIIRLQPTSPLRTSEDIDKGLELFESNKAESIIGVTECPVTPLWTNTLPGNLSMHNFISPEIRLKNRQDFPTYYQLNGALFIARWDFIKQNKSWYGPESYALIMPSRRSVDVDNCLDLEFVRFLIEKNENIN